MKTVSIEIEQDSKWLWRWSAYDAKSKVRTSSPNVHYSARTLLAELKHYLDR